MRAITLSLTIGFGVPALISCGDDVQGTSDARPAVDARTVDAAPDASGPVFKGFDADEGGELRMEYVRFAGGNAGSRTTGFLWKNVGTTKFFPFPNLNGCTNSSTDMNWPTATNPIAERVYLDPGSIIISGGPQIQNIPRRTVMGTDPFGRTHPANQWFFDPATGMDTDAPLTQAEKTKYDVIFTGSADMPAQVFDDVLYHPADFQVLTPGLTPLSIPAGTPQTFTWTTPMDNPPAGYMVLSLVAFTGPLGPAVLCIEPNDGSITVPAAMIDIARATYPTGGTLARQTLTHVVRELKDNNGPTGKRIDFVSVWCYATGFMVP